MAVKTNFSSDEWKTVLEAPVLAGFAITAADPSGIFGTLKEGWANARKLATAKTSASDELSKSLPKISSPQKVALARMTAWRRS